jgi:hypothetical protein
MQKALFIVQTWCPAAVLSVNGYKTSMVLFTNNRKLVGSKKSILFGTELQLKNQVKYLGVILDETILIIGCRRPPLRSGIVERR